jgi:hypothetical protein
MYKKHIKFNNNYKFDHARDCAQKGPVAMRPEAVHNVHQTSDLGCPVLVDSCSEARSSGCTPRRAGSNRLGLEKIFIIKLKI